MAKFAIGLVPEFMKLEKNGFRSYDILSFTQIIGQAL
jgi:hypothetical protein